MTDVLNILQKLIKNLYILLNVFCATANYCIWRDSDTYFSVNGTVSRKFSPQLNLLCVLNCGKKLQVKWYKINDFLNIRNC